MDYREILDRLFRMSHSREMRLNLEIPKLLAEHLGFPERCYPTIHVAGTNGKGSTVTKIARALQYAGLKVGLYTSPHIHSYRERITINEKQIPEEAIVDSAEGLFGFIDKKRVPATFFELTTALAFDHFHHEKVDVAVIETGLGGRLDATNIIHPLLTVITSISRDHAEFLGESLEEIAGEKAGILKAGVPLVLGPHAHYAAIFRRAESLGCHVIKAPDDAGFYDRENQAIARTALEYLTTHFPLTSTAIKKGLLARPPCRFEEKNGVIFDVAHNPDGFHRLLGALDLFHAKTPLYALVGMCKDKEYEQCLSMLTRRMEKIFLVRANTERAASLEEMSDALKRTGYQNFAICEESALHAAREAGARGATLVVCGSFFLMHDVKNALKMP